MSGMQKSDRGLLERLHSRKPRMPGTPPMEETIHAWLIDRLAAHLEIDADDIDVREPFSNYGLDSRTAVGLSGELERWLGRSLSPTLVWDYPTIELVAKHLASEAGDVEVRQEP